MANRKKLKRVALDQSGGFQQSLGSISNLNVMSIKGRHDDEEIQNVDPSQTDASWWTGKHRLKLYVSTKGFGGKKVTICEGLPGADARQKQGLSRLLSKRLGARSFWKEERLCVQGDHVEGLKLFFDN